MLSYEICNKLKDAGSPQNTGWKPCTFEKNGHDAKDHTYMPEPCGNPEFYYEPICPTLSELIEACGDNLESMTRLSDGRWFVGSDLKDASGNREEVVRGSLEEAVAEMYLTINTKA